MYLLDQERRPYQVLNLGQHAELTRQIARDFSITGSIKNFSGRDKNVETYRQALTWLGSAVFQLLHPSKYVLDRFFGDADGVALIHGDTASTLIGLHLARRAKMRTGLVEAGLSSGNRLNPFPEEMVRRHCEKRAQWLFAPGSEFADNLKPRKLKGAIVDTQYNTGRDAMMLTLKTTGTTADPPSDTGTYSVMTLHRLETLASKRRLATIVSYAIKMASRIGAIRFFLHNPTRNALKQYGLLQLLDADSNIDLHQLRSYPEFLSQLCYCRYLLTDGGSIQEEASYISKPCIVLRYNTERNNGFGASATLATYDVATDYSFLKKQPIGALPPLDSTMDASHLILERLRGNRIAQGA
jgi:UDP-N-acetylglucosamine 2-epimerase